MAGNIYICVYIYLYNIGRMVRINTYSIMRKEFNTAPATVILNLLQDVYDP